MLFLLLAGGSVFVSAQVPGTLDPSFGSGGIKIIELGSDAVVLAISQDASGRIVSLVWSSTFSYDRAIQRYLPDGTLDSSFGTNGTFVLPDSLRPRLMAILTDGRIIVAGNVGNAPDPAFIACVLPNGGMDLSFSGDGVVMFSFFDILNYFEDLKIGPGNTIVIAGSGLGTNGRMGLVVRLLSDGTLDTSFGIGGVYAFEFGTQTFVNSIALLSDGAIVMGGITGQGGNAETDFFVARLLVDGSPDPLFGTNGFTELPYSTFGWGEDYNCSIARLPDGSVAMTGAVNLGVSPAGWLTGLVLTKLDPNGVQDSGFGNNGWQLFDLDSASISYTDLHVWADGSFLISSIYGLYLPSGGNTRTILLHAQPDGMLDPNFGTEGLLDLQFLGSSVQDLRSLIITADNGLLFGGKTTNWSAGPFEALLVKLHGPVVGVAEGDEAPGPWMTSSGLLNATGNVVRLSGMSGQYVRLELLDVLGRSVARLNESIVEPDGSIRFDLPSNVNHGGYLLQATIRNQCFLARCVY